MEEEEPSATELGEESAVTTPVGAEMVAASVVEDETPLVELVVSVPIVGTVTTGPEEDPTEEDCGGGPADDD